LKRRIKVIWGAGDVIKGRWFFGLFGVYDRMVGRTGGGWAISLRGLLLWLTGGALAGYLATATALLLWLDRNPYNRVAFRDVVLLPFRWENFQSLRGQSLIEEGKAALRARRWDDALFKLRAGLARDPGNLAARIQLASFYVASNQRPLARRTLVEGLGATFPGLPYLETVFVLAAQAEDFSEIAAVAARYLPQLEGDQQARARRWLRLRQLGSLQEQNLHEQVLAATRAADDIFTTARDEFRVISLIGLRRYDEARIELAAWPSLGQDSSAHVSRLLARVEREAGRLPEMERALDRLVAMSPAIPAPYVYRIVQLSLAGLGLNAERARADYLRRFGANPLHLTLLAEPLATVRPADIPTLEAVIVTAREQGFEIRPLQLLKIEALLKNREFRLARATLDKIQETEKPGRAGVLALASPLGQPSHRQEAAEKAQIEWLHALTDALLTPTSAAQSALVEAARYRSLDLPRLRSAVELLRFAGRLETAQTLLAMSERTFPRNLWADAQRAELHQLFAARPAPVGATSPKAGFIRGEKLFFVHLEEAMVAGDWMAARELIRNARTRGQELVWVAKRDADLLLARMRIEQACGERTAMLIATKQFLDGDERRASTALSFAQQIYATGAKEDAALVLREILRKSPDFGPAEKQGVAWRPKKQ